MGYLWLVVLSSAFMENGAWLGGTGDLDRFLGECGFSSFHLPSIKLRSNLHMSSKCLWLNTNFSLTFFQMPAPILYAYLSLPPYSSSSLHLISIRKLDLRANHPILFSSASSTELSRLRLVLQKLHGLRQRIAHLVRVSHHD